MSRINWHYWHFVYKLLEEVARGIIELILAGCIIGTRARDMILNISLAKSTRETKANTKDNRIRHDQNTRPTGALSRV